MKVCTPIKFQAKMLKWKQDTWIFSSSVFVPLICSSIADVLFIWKISSVEPP